MKKERVRPDKNTSTELTHLIFWCDEFVGRSISHLFDGISTGGLQIALIARWRVP